MGFGRVPFRQQSCRECTVGKMWTNKLAYLGLLLTVEPPGGRPGPSLPTSGLEPCRPMGGIWFSWLFSLEAPPAGSQFITHSAYNRMNE